MATLTGSNLLDSIIDSTGIEPNALIQATLSARLQQMIDDGTFSNLAASIAMSGFSTEINAGTEVPLLSDAIETNVGLIEAAADQDAVDAIDFPDYGGPAPITFTLTASEDQINEGDANTFTVEASRAVDTDTDVVFQLRIDADGDTAQLGDFNAGAFNPVTVTIAAGETTATFDLTAITNDGTEVSEKYTMEATVDGQSLSTQVTILDGDVGGGQTFTLTTGLDIIPGMAGSNGNTVTSGDDLIIGVTDSDTAANSTLNTTDLIDAGEGTDTLKVVAVGTSNTTVPTNFENVQVLEVQSTETGLLTVNTSGVTGLTDLNLTKAAGVVAATAAGTTDVDVSMKAAGAALGVDGGNTVNVALTDVAAAADVVTIGGTTAAKGDVTASVTGEAYAAGDVANTLSAVNVTGGTTISVTQSAGDVTAGASDTSNAGNAITQGAITVDADANTTKVDVKQDAAVSAVDAAATTGGVTESASVVFAALKATETLIAGGVTFTAAKDMTAEQVAATFANLANNSATTVGGTPTLAGDTQSGGLASLGTYTNNFSGWTSGAATGDTVVFTSTTANAAVGDLTFGGTGTAPTVTTTQGKAHDGDITGGKTGIVAGKVDITNGAALTEVTVDGFSAATSNINGASTVLDTLMLKNGGAFTTSNGAAEFGLTLENVNGLYTQTAGAATLNVNTVGDNTAGLAAANSTTLNVAGTGLLDASTGSVFTALTTLKVSETAGLNLGATALTNVTSIDTSATTGTVTTAFDGTKAVYTGGAGMDMATVTNAGTAVSKAIDLAGGNDKLTLVGATVTTPTATLDGGDGDGDMLSLDAASAVLLGAPFASKVINFEQLEITAAAGAQAIDVEALGNYDDVTMVAVTGGATTLNNFATGGTLRFDTVANAVNAANEIVVAVKDADTNPADTLNVAINANVTPDGTADNHGTLTAVDVEIFDISLTDGIIETPIDLDPDTQILNLKAADANTVNISGDAPFTLTLDATTDELATVNGGLLTESFDFDLSAYNGVAVTVTGGSGNDILKASVGANAKSDVLIGGDGADQLVAGTNGATLTGGADNDLFLLTSELTGTVGVGNKEVNTYSTITDFEAGDQLQLEYITAAGAKAVVTGFDKLAANLNEDTSTFQNFADAAIDQAGLGDAVWFEFNANAYVVVDSSDGTAAVDANSTSFANGIDLAIKLTGVDMDTASFNATYGTVEIA